MPPAWGSETETGQHCTVCPGGTRESESTRPSAPCGGGGDWSRIVFDLRPHGVKGGQDTAAIDEVCLSLSLSLLTTTLDDPSVVTSGLPLRGDLAGARNPGCAQTRLVQAEDRASSLAMGYAVVPCAWPPVCYHLGEIIPTLRSTLQVDYLAAAPSHPHLLDRSSGRKIPDALIPHGHIQRCSQMQGLEGHAVVSTGARHDRSRVGFR